MANKILDKDKERLKRLDEISILVDILSQMDAIDETFGSGMPIKMKILNKIDDLLDEV